MNALRRLAIGVAVLSVAAACSGGPDEAARVARSGTPITLPSPAEVPGTTATIPGGERPEVVRAALASYSSCDELAGEVRADALALVGPWGLEGGGYHVGRAALAEDAATTAVAAPADGGASGTGGGDVPAFSGTNVQEAGVDEPDLVKTDGARILALAGNRLHHVLIEGGAPRLASTLTIGDGWPQELFLAGDRVLVLGSSDRTAPAPEPAESGDRAAGTSIAPEQYRPTATIWVVELGDGGSMRLVEALHLDGWYLSARMVDGIVRMVTASPAGGPAYVQPADDTPRAQEAALRRNRELVSQSTAADWLPGYVLVDHRGPTAVPAASGPLASCEDTMRPEEFSGLGTLTVLTVDPQRPRPDNAVSIMADGQIVYASTAGLYVATNAWDQAGGGTTQVHKFDIADAAGAAYRASGEVPGQAINQWALSEHAGHLRVATTVWGAEGGSESLVTVLAEQGDQLTTVGRVGDLGRGEQIYAVRYMGDTGYVVTFRQTDPLYVLDLSDPAAPAVRGELKILGYSAYLHPIGEGLLLGVGQDATEEGQRLGTQVSVFDVSDATNPQRIHQLQLGARGTSSQVEFDHRAFMWWEPSGRAVLPLQGWVEDGRGGGREILEAVALDVGAAGIGEAGRVSHQGRPTAAPDGYPMIQRSLVVGDTLFTVSTAGLLASDLGSLADRAWVRF